MALENTPEDRGANRPGRVAWVTGARGFLGGHVACRLARSGWRVIGLPGENRHADFDPAAEGIAEWRVGPLAVVLSELAELALAAPPAFVFHAAGTSSVAAAAADPMRSFDRMVRDSALLLDVLRRCAPRAHVVYPSSAAVYGMNDGGPLHEALPPAPASVYGWQKLQVENLLAAAQTVDGQPCTAVRFFSIYGPGLRKQVLWDWTRRLLAADRGPISFACVGDETRDFIHVDDAATLIGRLADSGGVAPLLVNGAAGRATRLRDLADLLIDATGRRGALTAAFNGEKRPGDPPYYLADLRRLSAFGFSAALPLERGVSSYVDWVKTAAPG